jgi:hypothetical protein
VVDILQQWKNQNFWPKTFEHSIDNLEPKRNSGFLFDRARKYENQKDQRQENNTMVGLNLQMPTVATQNAHFFKG